MSSPVVYDYDVVVVGAGHAGTEAAAAAARLGARVALLSMSADTVGAMSCNPAIGGVAKGQIVREIDALGGLMGQAIDRTGLQFRLLNRRKGPAMHSPRAQADKKAYQQEIKYLIEGEPNVHLRQETVEDLLTERNAAGEFASEKIVGVRVRGSAEYRARCVILTTGTFLKAIMHTGEAKSEGGRAGEGTTTGLSATLARLGFRLERFKTGTPPRLNGRTLDYDRLEPQPGDDDPQPFSFLTDRIAQQQMPCWIAHTNNEVHELIRANLHRAPMYSGQIQSSGPRYCPSIEDKVVRFAEKDRHQIFLEPEGYRTHEIYVNGVSTSLPRDVQDSLFRMIPGLERAQILRYGYAVEYDFSPPEQLWPSLETKLVEGLFFAGQLNGTTGYEEAAAQGLMAGINAARKLARQEPAVVDRSDGYIGVLIDDLVTRGVDEPYRMFTSRAEYRLLLRQDNADRRLTPVGRAWGLVDDERWTRFAAKQAEIERAGQILDTQRHEGVLLRKLLSRPETTWEEVAAGRADLAAVPPDVVEQLVYDTKYAGYIARQEADVERLRRLAHKRIPTTFDYERLRQLRTEARQKFQKVRPQSIAQAARISGITPADIALLTAHLQGSGGASSGEEPTPQPAGLPELSD